jgi:hypothetical protein
MGLDLLFTTQKNLTITLYSVDCAEGNPMQEYLRTALRPQYKNLVTLMQDLVAWLNGMRSGDYYPITAEFDKDVPKDLRPRIETLLGLYNEARDNRTKPI